MYDLIKAQYESGKSLVQSEYQSTFKEEYTPKFLGDLFPVGQDYYHPMNPMYVSGIPNTHMMKFNKVITARDGYAQFACFMLNFHQRFSQWDNHFIIDEELAPIVPPHLTEYFSVYKWSHTKSFTIDKAKKVIIFGCMADQFMGEANDLMDRLAPVKDIHPDAEIEVYLHVKANPFEESYRETLLIHKTISAIKEILTGREFTYIITDDFFSKVDFTDTYLLDLNFDKLTTSDNYIHYLVASRQGTVNKIPKVAPANSYFDVDISFQHRMHICEFPKVDSIFLDLVLHKKKALTKEILYDLSFHKLLRKKLKQNS